VNPSIPGTYPIVYTVSDSNFNTGTITRIVNVIDVIPPVVTLIGSSDITINAGSIYTDSGAYWTDNIDGSGFLLAQ
jgi:hypothetical protein